MITRLIRLQLVAFVVVAALGITYVGLNYVGLGGLVGRGGYQVQLQLASSGGIFSNAEVSYRGVTIGRIGELRLIPDGVEVDLHIDHDAPKVPTDLQAAVANRSAVGEQYVDLRPNTGDGPYLEPGSVIPMERTSTPLPVDTVLLNLDRLVTSVPTDSLRTVVDELHLAFNGTGPQLQTILDSTTALTTTATEHLPQTVDLIHDGRTVLNTVNDQSSAFGSFSSDLRLLAEQLATSDPDLRELIKVGPPASAELSALIADVGPGLSDLISDVLLVNNEVLLPRQANIKVPLIAYPIVAAGGYSVLDPNGWTHLSLSVNAFDPPPCTNGYQATEKREGIDTEPRPLDIAVNCNEPLASEIGVRNVKPGYPYRDGQPTPTPDWVCEKYGYASDRFGVDCSSGQPVPIDESTGADQSGQRPVRPAPLPGLLGAPDGAGAIEMLAELLGTGS